MLIHSLHSHSQGMYRVSAHEMQPLRRASASVPHEQEQPPQRSLLALPKQDTSVCVPATRYHWLILCDPHPYGSLTNENAPVMPPVRGLQTVASDYMQASCLCKALGPGTVLF